MKITVETVVKADLDAVWRAWNDPADIKQWNAASEDWHTTASAVDLREGGKFSARMEAKDGSEGFDFAGTYTRVVPQQLIEYRDAESENEPEAQRQGWQAILDSFARHVEAKAGRAR